MYHPGLRFTRLSGRPAFCPFAEPSLPCRANTLDRIKKHSETRPLLLPISKQNSGHGPTVIYGYRYALSHNADYIFQTDSDGQTDPSEFEDFWNLREKFDAAIGNRTNRGDGASRVFAEKIVCLLLRLYFGVNVPDANDPFRLMKADLPEKYIGKPPDDYDLPNIMLTAYFVRNSEKTAFREISFKSRQGGENSINPGKVLKWAGKPSEISGCLRQT